MSQLFWQPGMTLEDSEKIILNAALKFYQGNKSQTANALGVTVKTIYNKMEAYGIKGGQDDGYNQNHALESEKIEQEKNVTATGSRVESAVKVSEEFPMSLRQQAEIQKVSSKPTSANARK